MLLTNKRWFQEQETSSSCLSRDMPHLPQAHMEQYVSRYSLNLETQAGCMGLTPVLSAVSTNLKGISLLTPRHAGVAATDRAGCKELIPGGKNPKQ